MAVHSRHPDIQQDEVRNHRFNAIMVTSLFRDEDHSLPTIFQDLSRFSKPQARYTVLFKKWLEHADRVPAFAARPPGRLVETLRVKNALADLNKILTKQGNRNCRELNKPDC
jgi:hypothetical protein